eukprot:3149280-Amphidinium_carterae.1
MNLAKTSMVSQMVLSSATGISRQLEIALKRQTSMSVYKLRQRLVVFVYGKHCRVESVTVDSGGGTADAVTKSATAIPPIQDVIVNDSSRQRFMSTNPGREATLEQIH